MPTVADYAVLLDDAVEIEAGESFKTIPFFRPDGFVAGTNLAKAIIAFKVRPLSLAPFTPHAEFKITKLSMPDVTLTTLRLDGDTLRGLWEAFPATGIGQNIGTEFEFSMSKGRARFADIILWYQVRV